MYSARMHDLIEATIRTFLDSVGLPYSGLSKRIVAGQTVFAIETDVAPAIIGTHGDTLHAMDYLVKKIVEQQIRTRADGAVSEEALFLIDVNDYRAKKLRDLEAKAKIMAERARSFQYDVELSPMSAYERLIIHSTLADEPNIKTESQGEGRTRRVVIKYTAE